MLLIEKTELENRVRDLEKQNVSLDRSLTICIVIGHCFSVSFIMLSTEIHIIIDSSYSLL